MNNYQKYLDFRDKYPVFKYNSFNIVEKDENIEIIYDFEIEGLSSFHPKWVFEKPIDFQITEKNRNIIENIVFNLGMVEIISYYKISCPKEIIVNAAFLNSKQINWYKKLFFYGLGEFFYTNEILDNITADNFVKIKSNSEKKFKRESVSSKISGNLIPIGGGKDSLVTLDMLKEYKKDNTFYSVNYKSYSEKSVLISGYEKKDLYIPKRFLDIKIFELNKLGFLNGHTPFSAILAFSSYLTAIMLNKKNIILSNEESANEANVQGTKVNHQYSKSYEFEKDFREYVSKYISNNGPNYFSILRPISEWQIVKCFSKLEKYFPVFISCNAGHREEKWCENCPKCLYMYIMLKAFLEEEDLKKIFKTNMLENINNLDIFNGLVFENIDKPFECVGTKKEINLALKVILKKIMDKKEKVPELMKAYVDENNINYIDIENEIRSMEKKFDSQNFLNKEFKSLLKKYLGEL